VKTRLYLGNLPYSITEEELRRLFEQAGVVQEVYLPRDRYTGELRGFGFVEMGSEEAAAKAIQALSGHLLGGRQLIVNEARERAERGYRRS
jgi:RNA recognition motif-containing protein